MAKKKDGITGKRAPRATEIDSKTETREVRREVGQTDRPMPITISDAMSSPFSWLQATLCCLLLSPSRHNFRSGLRLFLSNGSNRSIEKRCQCANAESMLRRRRAESFYFMRSINRSHRSDVESFFQRDAPRHRSSEDFMCMREGERESERECQRTRDRGRTKKGLERFFFNSISNQFLFLKSTNATAHIVGGAQIRFIGANTIFR